jgi:hypothetical protein
MTIKEARKHNQIKFERVDWNGEDQSLQFGTWKVQRSGSYESMNEGIFTPWAGDWILTRNGEFYGSFDKLKEVKFYIRLWLSINPNDL